MISLSKTFNVHRCTPGHLFVEVNQCLFCLTGIDVKADDKVFDALPVFSSFPSGMSNNGSILVVTVVC